MRLPWRVELENRITSSSLLFLSLTLFCFTFCSVCPTSIFTTPNDIRPANFSLVHATTTEKTSKNFFVLANTKKSEGVVIRQQKAAPKNATSFTKRSKLSTWHGKGREELETSTIFIKKVTQTVLPATQFYFTTELQTDEYLTQGNSLEITTNAVTSSFIDVPSIDGIISNFTTDNDTILTKNYTRETDSLWLWILKATIMVLIILVSVLGNALVIVSVALHRRLHCAANYLLVSLATADLLVALCVMTFNASMELSGGRWLFGGIMCDLWNSFDVYFSTVSILHLCSISVDRYYAIVRPLEYPITMTRQMLATMLAQAWLAPMLISFLPIFLGWYTTSEYLKLRALHQHICVFQVNAVYAVLSSSVSFWVPCAVMMVMYFRIFQEARKQENAMINRASSGGGSGRSNGTQQEVARQQLMLALQGSAFTAVPEQQEILMKNLSDASSNASVTTACTDSAAGSGSSRSSSAGPATNLSIWRRQSRKSSIASWAGCSSVAQALNRRPPALPPLLPPPAPPGRREHKAARTLGLIMGAFVLCWLPFFTWYVSINICGESCHTPHEVVTTVFWIGYFNSTLNPFIYVYFRSDFRAAFQNTLARLQCCKSQESVGVFV